MLAVIQGALLFLFPLGILVAATRYKGVAQASPILLSYIAGIVLANLPFIPLDRSLSMTVSEISVPLAIPLLLFATDIAKWLRLAKKTILSFCLVLLAGMASAALGALIFGGRIAESQQIAAMLTGVYTGGTPNLMAIGLALNVSEETFVLVNGADVIMGGIYFLFLLLAAKPLLRRFLPAFTREETPEEEIQAERAFRDFPTAEKVKRTGVSFLAALLLTAISIGISMLFFGELISTVVILSLTTLGIACSFAEKIRNYRGPYEVGNYLLLVFSMAIGTTVNIGEMLSASTDIFLYTAFIMTGAIIIHYLLSALFRIDMDTVLITSTAGIYGPAFIGPVAGILNNKDVIAPGLITGLVGYAVGNYLGLALAFLLIS